uniref:HMG-Y-related protein A n=2 Tax=Anthurium amnicola TaxID=1678845 RepID=A0A1D1XNA5_9ARAE
MILTAIDELNEKNGSNKSKISKCIESKHSDLPAGHSILLSHHLNKMKDAGELVFSKNSYMRPDPNSPPKRGRGRPPKPKEPLTPGAVPSSPKRRGRPPKAKDPLAVAAAKAAEGLPKRRGRPPKKARPVVAPAAPGVKRGRGRPPKAKPTVAAVGA